MHHMGFLVGAERHKGSGYTAVHRAIEAGFIKATRTPHGWYRLTVD